MQMDLWVVSINEIKVILIEKLIFVIWFAILHVLSML